MSLSRITDQEHWTWDAYIAWSERQPIRYELVDGNLYAMTGGSMAHDWIANNIRTALRAKLKGACRPHGADLRVKAGENGRFPDVVVDCGPFVASALVAQEPRAVFEVLSPSTAWVDQILKLRDYDGVATLADYVLVDQGEARVIHYRRDAAGHLSTTGFVVIEGIDAVIELPGLAVAIPLAAIYSGVPFED